jgi:hypothetical protein
VPPALLRQQKGERSRRKSYLPALAGVLVSAAVAVLSDQTYESLARKGETMTTAAIATYAYDQIDQARTELEHPS